MTPPWAAVAAAALLAVPATARASAPAGDVDPAFHGGRPEVVDLSRGSQHATEFRSLLRDGRGRVLVGGDTTDADGRIAMAVARLDARGAPDPAFGHGGTLIRQLSPTGSSWANGLFAVAGGYAGASVLGPEGVHAVFELTDYGDPATSFGTGGIATQGLTPLPAVTSTAGATAGPDGSVYVSGEVNFPGTASHANLALTKYTPSGWPASAFGTHAGTFVGSFARSPGDANTWGRAVVMQTPDRLLVAGSAALGGGHGALLARFSSATGQPDPPFGTRPGRTLTDASQSEGGHAGFNALVSAPGREIYAAGYATGRWGVQTAMVARYTPRGRLDRAFGAGGIARLQLSGIRQTSTVHRIAIQHDGKLLLLASARDRLNRPYPRVVRLRPDGTRDPSFGNHGVVTLQFAPRGRHTLLEDMTIAGDRLLVAGVVHTGAGHTAGVLVRILL
jgi:uncharacterized delta-60 repeat protein